MIDPDEWEPCEVCCSQERKPYLVLARGGVCIPHPKEDSHGILFDRAFDTDDECSVCGHLEEREPPIYLCFDCVPQWLELTALSIPSRENETP